MNQIVQDVSSLETRPGPRGPYHPTPVFGVRAEPSDTLEKAQGVLRTVDLYVYSRLGSRVLPIETQVIPNLVTEV